MRNVRFEWVVAVVMLLLAASGCSEDAAGDVTKPGCEDGECCEGEECCEGDECCEDEACGKPSERCGNGVLDEGEACDIVGGVADFGGKTCADFVSGDVVMGSLACRSNCTIDASDCRESNVVEPECLGDELKCDIYVGTAFTSHAQWVCDGGKWKVLDFCAGSCDSVLGCVPCREGDPLCEVLYCAENYEAACREECCDLRESFCDMRGTGGCCAYTEVCGRECCSEGMVCENAVCRKACPYTRCVDDEGGEICCGEREMCVSNQCFEPSVSCNDAYACENGQYCESTLGMCMPQPTTQPACVRKPSGGEVVPTLLWHWGATPPEVCPANVQVMSAPMVADLDGDGYPEIIFNAFTNNDHATGVIRVVDGRTGELKFTITGTGANLCNLTVGGAQIAIGDLTGDGFPDIVTCAAGSNTLIAFNNKGERLWQTERRLPDGTPIGFICGQSGPGIADFYGTGKPDVYVSYTVVDGRTGAIKWSKPCEGGYVTSGNYLHHACEYSVAADLDGDGILELVGGNVAFRADGSEYYRVAGMRDGYPAVADVTLDGKPNVAVTGFAEHQLILLDNAGNILWRADLNAGISGASGAGGGPPNIANIDDDPYPEITLAGAWAYQAFKHDGTRLWFKYTKDHSSRKTGSSIFDFNGDGTAEAVYADEEWLRVYDGKTGATVFCMPNTSATHWEYPVIADVNGDGAAEIVVSSNNYSIRQTSVTLPVNQGRDECVSRIIGPNPAAPLIPQTHPSVQGTAGVRVFAAPNRDWVGTRKIWNQHAYSITNINDDGTVPRRQRPNWLVDGLNNFRLNAAPGVRNLPNTVIENVASSTFLCADTVQLYFEVRNSGWAAAVAGLPVRLFLVGEGGEQVLLATIQTTRALLPGEFESLSYRHTRSPGDGIVLTFYLEVGDADLQMECEYDNKGFTFEYRCDRPVN